MAESGGISGVGVAAVFAGGILVWSGVKGVSVSGLTRDLIAGKSPSNLQQTSKVSIGGLITGVIPGIHLTGTPVTPTNAGVGGNEAQNKALGQRMAAAIGWTGDQWTALNNIVMAESSWSSTVTNPGSGAAGIAQKISGFGPGYQSGNAGQQIAWLIAYIKGRYGNPVNAWNFHLAHGWY